MAFRRIQIRQKKHDKLMTIFGRTIKDGDVISLVRKFLVSGVMIDDEYEDTIVGTPRVV